jgi:hypothetical protein
MTERDQPDERDRRLLVGREAGGREARERNADEEAEGMTYDRFKLPSGRDGRKMYDDEPWAWLAREAGYEPFDTESAARNAFQFCAEKFGYQIPERTETQTGTPDENISTRKDYGRVLPSAWD